MTRKGLGKPGEFPVGSATLLAVSHKNPRGIPISMVFGLIGITMDCGVCKYVLCMHCKEVAEMDYYLEA